jgi:hypothetical protein
MQLLLTAAMSGPGRREWFIVDMMFLLSARYSDT